MSLDWQNNNFARASRFFLYISLPSLHDYKVKVPHFAFCRGREHKTTLEFNSKNIASIWRIKRDVISVIKFEAARIHILSDVFVAVAVLLLKLPIRDLKIRWRRQQRVRQKRNRCNDKNNNFAPASRFFVHVFAVAARLRRENVWFHVLQRKYSRDDKISSLFLNLDMVLRNSTLGGFAYIWQS